MDALQLLVADHNRVRGLFELFQTAEKGDDGSTMASVAARIFEELEVHTTIEEELFYPAVTDLTPEIHDVVTEGIEEHHVAKTLMAEAKALEAGSETWVAKMKVLIEGVEHHAEEEETEMFPKVRSASAAGELDTLAERLDARKAQLGAPTIADKIDLTKDELLSKARAQAIPGRSTMSKEELAATVAPS